MKIFKEKAGVISQDVCWVCIPDDGYLYIADTFTELLIQIATEWRDDKHLVG